MGCKADCHVHNLYRDLPSHHTSYQGYSLQPTCLHVTVSVYIYIYIYIYMCVCVCVCATHSACCTPMTNMYIYIIYIIYIIYRPFAKIFRMLRKIFALRICYVFLFISYYYIILCNCYYVYLTYLLTYFIIKYIPLDDG